MRFISWLAGGAVAFALAAPAMAAVPAAEFQFSFPAPHRNPIPRDVDTLALPVADIVVDGSTVFSRSDVAPLMAPLAGGRATMDDIIGVAEAIEAKYRAAGYLLVRAFVPRQEPKGDVFHITVVEGALRDVVVEGVQGAQAARLAAVLEPVRAQRPLRAATVERVLLLANDLPGLTVSGLVRPARDAEGEADLVVTAAANPVEVSATVDNWSSRYAGPWQATADVAANDLLGRGEQLTLGVTASPTLQKTRAIRGRWLQPVGSDGLFLTTYAQGERDLAGFTLREYGEVTRSVTLGQRAAWPLVRSRTNNLVLDGGIAVRSTTVEMQNSEYYGDRWRVVDAKLSWAQSGWLGASSSLSADVSHGLSMLGGSAKGAPTLSRLRADPDFTKLVIDLKARWRLDSALSFYVAASGQYAFTPVFESEEFAAGASAFGRGYDPSAVLGDRGVGSTAEMQYDIPDTPWADAVQGFAFVDHAKAWDAVEPETQPFLASTGIGARAWFGRGTSLTAQLAHPLHGPDSTVANSPVRPYLSLSTRF